MLTDPARDQWLRNAAFVYAIAFVVHTGDHLRRGTESTTTHVFVLGTAAAVLQVIAIGAVLTRHRLAPVFAVAVGFPDALGIAAVHFLPDWGVFSDAFPNAHGTGVTTFSWIAGGAEVVAAFLFGLAGWYALKSTRDPRLRRRVLLRSGA